MKHVQKIYCLFTLMLLVGFAHGQVTTADFTLTVLNEQSKPAATATVELLKADKLVKAAITDANGVARFGKAYKTVKRTSGSASDEIERAGNG